MCIRDRGEQGAPALVMTNKGELEFATIMYGADPVHYAKSQLALTSGKNTEVLDGALRVADQVDPATQSRALYFVPDRMPCLLYTSGDLRIILVLQRMK